jgi:hypothetical protein
VGIGSPSACRVHLSVDGSVVVVLKDGSSVTTERRSDDTFREKFPFVGFRGRFRKPPSAVLQTEKIHAGRLAKSGPRGELSEGVKQKGGTVSLRKII